MRRFRLLLAVSDPGFIRLRTAAHGLISAGGATLLLTSLARWSGHSPVMGLVGVMVVTMSSLAVQDPSPRSRKITTLLVPVVAAAALAAGTALSGFSILSRVVFVAVIFLAMLLRRFGPRGAALGMIGYIAFFLALFFRAQPSTLPWLMLNIAVAGALGYVVRFWILPENPLRTLERKLELLRARLLLLLDDLQAGLHKPTKTRRIRRRLLSVSDAVLDIFSDLDAQENHAWPSNPETKRSVEERLLRYQMASESLASSVLRLARNEDQPRASGLRKLLDRLTSAVEAGTPPHLPSEEAASLSSNRLFARAARAAQALVEEPAWQVPSPDQPIRVRRFVFANETPGGSQQQPSGSSGSSGNSFFGENTILAIRTTAAAAAAIAAGTAVSATRWYWAVIAAFVVFSRATTLGHTISRAWQRIVGTLVGVGLGIGLASVAAGHQPLQLALIFLFLTLGFYLFRISYAVFIVLITTVLALLYTLLGRYSAGLLVLRLEETLIGAAIGILAASVFPRRTSREAGQLSVKLLRSAAGLIRARRENQTQPGLHSEITGIDKDLQALRRLVSPVAGLSFPFPRSDLSTRVRLLTQLAYCLRHLLTAMAVSPEPFDQPAMRRLVELLATSLEESADLLEADRDHSATAAANLDNTLQKFGREAAKVESETVETAPSALEWLQRSGQILQSLRPQAADAGALAEMMSPMP